MINKQSREEDVCYYLNLRLQNCFIFSPHFPSCNGGNFLSTVEFLQLYWASHFYFFLYWPNHLVSLFNYNSQPWLRNGIFWGALKSTDAWSHSRNFNWPQNFYKAPWGLGFAARIEDTLLFSQVNDIAFSRERMAVSYFSLFLETSLKEVGGQDRGNFYGHLVNMASMNHWKSSAPHSCTLHGPITHFCPL